MDRDDKCRESPHPATQIARDETFRARRNARRHDKDRTPLRFILFCEVLYLSNVKWGGGTNNADSTVNSQLRIHKSDAPIDTQRRAATLTPIDAVYPRNPFGDVNLTCPFCMVVTFWTVSSSLCGTRWIRIIEQIANFVNIFSKHSSGV